MGKLHRDEMLLIKLAIGCVIGYGIFFAFAIWKWPL
jgi:hypothetical protein